MIAAEAGLRSPLGYEHEGLRALGGKVEVGGDHCAAARGKERPPRFRTPQRGGLAHLVLTLHCGSEQRLLRAKRA